MKILFEKEGTVSSLFKKENDKTSVAAAVSVTAFMLICLAVTVIVIDTRKGGVLTNRFKNMFIKRK